MFTFITGVSLYLLLCIISILAGAGLIYLLRLRLPLSAAMVLAPILTLVGWSLVLGIGVGFRVPVRCVSVALWGLTFGAIGYFFGRVFNLRSPIPQSRNQPSLNFAVSVWPSGDAERRSLIVDLLRQGWLVLVCIAAPIVVLLPYFRYGIADYQGSIMPDGWAYAAIGQYLWEYPRGANGGLAPLYQYGAAFSETRFVASSLLGFLSPLFSSGDTQPARTLFLAWTLFMFASGCAFFGLAQSLRRLLLFTYVCLAVLSGWVCNLIWATNYDNALALSYAPAIAGTMIYFRPSSWNWRIVLGAFGAGLLYCYPELAPIILVSPLFILAYHCWQERSNWRTWLIALGASLAVTLLLTLPFLPWIYSFIQAQVVSGMQASARPGEGFFQGLVIARYQPAAFWGLGGEYQIDSRLVLRNGLGVLLSMIAAAGMVRLLWRRQLGIVGAVVLFCGATAFFILRQSYSYGAYKIILLNWWLLCFVLVFALDGLANRLPHSYRSAGLAAICLPLVAVLFLFNRNGLHAPSFAASRYEQSDMGQYRSVEQVKRIIGDATLLVAVDDWLASEWAIYFLRDTPLHLAAYRMYMASPWVSPTMDRAQTVPPEKTEYVLTDSTFSGHCGEVECWALVWSGGPYRLWRPNRPDWSLIADIINTNGVEQYQGKQFFWMGAGDTTVRVVTSQTGILHIDANFIAGPITATNQLTRTIEVTNNTGYRQRKVVASGEYRLAVPVPAGTSDIVLRAIDTPLLSTGPNEDPRPRPVGVQDITTSIDNASAILEQVDNPYGVDQLQGKPFFWIGPDGITLNIEALRAGAVQISGTFYLGPNVPVEQQTRTVDITTGTGYHQLSVIAAGEQTLSVPVPQGPSQITLRPRDRPTIPPEPSGDPRLRVLGIQGLTLFMEEPQMK